MSRVSILKSKLDSLAEHIGIKAIRRVPLTIDEMIETRIKQVIPEIVKQVILSGKTDYQCQDNDVDSIDSGEY